MEHSAPIPRFQKSVMTVSKRNKYALVQKLRVINDKCSKTLNEVGARLIERKRNRKKKRIRDRKGEERMNLSQPNLRNTLDVFSLFV